MAEENISQEFRLKNVDETKKCLTEERNPNELMNKKHKNVCTTLNYIEKFLILGFKITWCASISAFASSVGNRTGAGNTKGLKICAITAPIKK